MDVANNQQQGFFHKPRLPQYNIKPSFYKHHHQYNRQSQYQDQLTNATNFDGKRMRKTMTRRTVDYNASVVKLLENRVWQRDSRDIRALQPDSLYTHELVSPCELVDNPISAVATKFVRTATNKIRCPIFCVVWTPEGRRLVTGASSGEFTLWNGMTFNFETILQAHDYPVRSMVWSHNNLWLLSGDHMGYVKYWQTNMNNVRMFQAHVDQAIREITFSPTDSKFATCSDDGSVRVFDFFHCHEERILRGHGADVKCLDWHPHKSIIVSGSKDSQQPVKLWDAKSGLSLATLHAHKSTVMSAKWNRNGNWLLTASRDHLVKVFDIRAMKEMSICRGHKKEATCVAWHPYFEDIFASGGSDGSLLYWQVGHEKEVGGIEQAHDSIVWSLAWHPLGHILCSGSNDHSTKFWTRNRPGDKMRDKYNLNTLPQGMFDDTEYDDDTVALPAIPGMGLEQSTRNADEEDPSLSAVIPGLDSSAEELAQLKPTPQRKVPYAKPIPADFQRKWEAKKAPGIAPKEVLEKELVSGPKIVAETRHSLQQPGGPPQVLLHDPSIPPLVHLPQGPPVAGPPQAHADPQSGPTSQPMSAPKHGLLGTCPPSGAPMEEGSQSETLPNVPKSEGPPPVQGSDPIGSDVDMRLRFSDVDMRHAPGSAPELPPVEGVLDGTPQDRDMRQLPSAGPDAGLHDEDLRQQRYRNKPPPDFDDVDFRSPHRDEDLRSGRGMPFRGPAQSMNREQRLDEPHDMDMRRENFDNDEPRNFQHGGMNHDDGDRYRGRGHSRSGGLRQGIDREEPDEMNDQQFHMDRGFPQNLDGPPRGMKRDFDDERGQGMGRGFDRSGYRGGSRRGGPWRGDNMGRGGYRGGFRGGRGGRGGRGR